MEAIYNEAFEKVDRVVEVYAAKHPEKSREIAYLQAHNYNVLTIKVGRQKTNFGLCTYSPMFFSRDHDAVYGCEITYHKKLLEEEHKRRFLSTIVHEIFHAVAQNVNPGCHHGGAWKELATIYNKYFPEDEVISRCGSWEREMTIEDTKPKERKPKYRVYCDCGYEKQYKIRTKVVKAAENFDAICPNCGKHLHLRYI